MSSLSAVLEKTGVQRGVVPLKTIVISTGFSELDRHLEGGGWPAGVFTELRLRRPGIGEMRLLRPALRTLSQEARMLWVAPPYRPYAPTLRAWGIALDRLVIIRPTTHREALWAVSQGLLSSSVSVVVSWFADMREKEFRALQRQASEGGRWSFCFLPESLEPRPSRLRLVLEPAVHGLRIISARQVGRPVAPLVITI